MTDATGHAELIAHLLRSFENKTLVHWARGKEAADALAAADMRWAQLLAMPAAKVVPLDNAIAALEEQGKNNVGTLLRALAQARKDALEEAAAAVDRWAGIEPPSQSSFGAAIRALSTKGETG